MYPEYLISRPWKIFACFFILLFAGAMVYVGALPFINHYENGLTYILLPLLSISVIAGLIVAVLDTVRRKLTITGDEVSLTSWNKTDSIPLNAIKGFRNDENYLVIEATEDFYPSLKISKYFEKREEIKSYFRDHYTDLDAAAYEETEKELMKEDELGTDEGEKTATLKKLKTRVSILNTAAVISFFWLLFYPHPYKIAIYSAAIIPWIVLYMVRDSKGIIKIDERKNSAYPNASLAFTFPMIGLLIRSLLDVSLLSWAPLIKYILFLAVVLYALALTTTKMHRNKKKFAQSLVFLLFIAAYSYGLVAEVNSLEDKGPSKVFTATVTGKHESSGKTTTYYLSLSPWGPRKKEDDVNVARSFYERSQVGETVHVYLKNGALGGQWFFVTE